MMNDEIEVLTTTPAQPPEFWNPEYFGSPLHGQPTHLSENHGKHSTSRLTTSEYGRCPGRHARAASVHEDWHDAAIMRVQQDQKQDEVEQQVYRDDVTQ